MQTKKERRSEYARKKPHLYMAGMNRARSAWVIVYYSKQRGRIKQIEYGAKTINQKMIALIGNLYRANYQ